MDLNQLKSFVAVAHQGNLTQAAEILHLSQPAVSAQIKAIEKNLDITLFQRNAQGMQLTHAGEAFLPQAEALLQHMHKLDVFAAGLAQSHVASAKIGIIHPLPRNKLSRMVSHLTEHMPNLHLHLQDGLSVAVLNEVRKKNLDAGFFVGTNPYRNISTIAVGEVHYVVLCPQAWLPEITANPIDGLQRYPWIDMSAFSSSSKFTQNFWRTHKLHPQTALICDHIATTVDLVAAGIGVALVPQADADKAMALGKTAAILPGFVVTEALHFIYPIEHEFDPTLVALRESVSHAWELHPQA